MSGKVYLAGPFFNTEQQMHIEMVEKILTRHHVSYFSPRKQGGVLKPKASRLDRRQILDTNVRGISEASCVLAVLDWMNPNDHAIHLVRTAPPDTLPSQVTLAGPPLNLPDTGTVWEIGFSYGIRVPVIGFLMNREGKFNAMLTEAMAGIAYGFEQLERFADVFGKHGLNENYVIKELESWNGETT